VHRVGRRASGHKRDRKAVRVHLEGWWKTDIDSPRELRVELSPAPSPPSPLPQSDVEYSGQPGLGERGARRDNFRDAHTRAVGIHKPGPLTRDVGRPGLRLSLFHRPEIRSGRWFRVAGQSLKRRAVILRLQNVDVSGTKPALEAVRRDNGVSRLRGKRDGVRPG